MSRQVPATKSPYAVKEILVSDDPTIFPKLDNETYQDSTTIMIWVNKCCKN